jgi:hypothetical protein
MDSKTPKRKITPVEEFTDEAVPIDQEQEQEPLVFEQHIEQHEQDYWKRQFEELQKEMKSQEVERRVL